MILKIIYAGYVVIIAENYCYFVIRSGIIADEIFYWDVPIRIIIVYLFGNETMMVIHFGKERYARFMFGMIRIKTKIPQESSYSRLTSVSV